MGDRGNLDTHCREIAERIWPNQARLFNTKGFITTKGEKRTDELFDSTASVALNRFSAILDSLLTPRGQKWHRLVANDPNLMKDREAKLWFEEATRRLFKYRYAPKANFVSQNARGYKSLGAYGTAVLFIDKLQSEPGLRYRDIHLSESYIFENHQGLPDKIIRFFALEARQAHQKWGDALPEKILSAAKEKPTEMFYFLHCVEPREDYDPIRIDYMGMRYASYYMSVEGRTILEQGGYRSFPYAVSRYDQESGETYGRSPAMDVLPAIKTLNEEKKVMLKQGHRTVDPVLLVHDDGILDTLSLRPGSAVSGGISKEGRELVKPLPIGNVQIGKELMDDERTVINDAFLVTLFQILTETPTMSATEVLERAKEKGILIAPTVGRQESERLGPQIERELDCMSQQGLLPPMPPVLREAKGEYAVEYDSPLTRAQRAEEAAGLMRSIENTLQIVNVTQNPAPLDWYDFDTITPEIADIQGVPTKWMRGLGDVQTIRKGRAAEAQKQQQTMDAPGQAALIKAASVAGEAK